MRIQHNIMAMNAYRNYGNNTSALSKNLEKLSSGYRINRAGDDAAGLAISEKMRAQIQGLNAAQKNVKDGISLVKTAEGAMQEIQDMLSRMKYLATQSANGTYDDDVDRKALQDEVNQLNEEINRIADSANFNGTKLLDGSLGGGGGSAGKAEIIGVTSGDIAATAGVYTATFDGLAAALDGAGAKASVEFTFSDGKKVTVEIEATSTTAFTVTIDGQSTADTSGAISNTSLSAAIQSALTVSGFAITDNAGTLTFTASEAGTSTPALTGATWSATKSDDTEVAGSFAVKATTEAADDMKSIDPTAFTVYDGDPDNLEDAIFTINGQKFVLVTDASKAKNLDPDITVIIGDKTTGDGASIAAQLAKATGLKVGYDTTDNVITIGGGGKGGGLQLQIGDTADSYNQLKVSVKDMHTAAIGVAGVDISKIDSAASAIDVIKDGINYVSSVRGTLGAIQNRLEHTQNNLSVMAENIQDAESTIRDTDVADEMMAYTKNNILIQSAQAMLAQANAVPQGVLQLLG